jgi:hypothetical protein
MLLTNLLPGLRELRTPLAAGYLLFLAIFVFWHDEITSGVEQKSGLIGELSKLASSAGTGPTLAALTFAAYVVGIAWTQAIGALIGVVVTSRARLSKFLNRRVRRSAGEVVLTPDTQEGEQKPDQRSSREKYSALPIGDRLSLIIRTKQSSLRQKYTDRGRDPNKDTILQTILDRTPAPGELKSEFAGVPGRLLGKDPELWSAWDRNRSEAEFRITMAFSTAVLFLSFSRAGWLWYLAILLSVILWLAGKQKDHEATELLIGAIEADRIQLPLFENIATTAAEHI